MTRSQTPSMRRRARSLSSVVALVVLALGAGCSPNAAEPAPGPKPTPTRPIRYLVLGDSITHGSQVPGGYRTALWEQLVETDHDRLDFVGSMSSGPPALGDQDHEGHPGWCIAGSCRGGGHDTVLPRIDGWMDQYRPDIVSIHLGTNDLNIGATGATTAKRLEQLVSRIYADQPRTYVVLVQPIPMGTKQAQHDAYEALIPQVADTYRAQGRRIAVADLSHVLTFPDDYRDELHPTQQGYDRMGLALAPTIQAAYTSLF